MKYSAIRRSDEEAARSPGDDDGGDVELRPSHAKSDLDDPATSEASERKGKHSAALAWWRAGSILGGLLLAAWLLISSLSDEVVEALRVAMRRGFHVGVAGAAAMSVQVILFMWTRTIICYQYRHGGSMVHVFTTLWREGGVFRLYKGVLLSLFQAPLSRFGDTAMNEGMQSLLGASAVTRDLPMGIKSVFCAFAAGLFRIVIMPVDTVKVKLQVEGSRAVAALLAKVMAHGPGCLFDGWLANQVAAMVSHYPWFATRNYMRSVMDASWWGVYRDVVIGVVASLASDVASNSARVLKTHMQTSDRPISYREVVANVVRADGLGGLFFRGLRVKMVASAVQSVVFNVVWEQFQRLQLAGGGVGVAVHPVVGNVTVGVS